MQRTQDRTVTYAIAQRRNALHKVLLCDLAQNRLLELQSNGLHLAAHRRVLVRQIRMVSTCVDNAQRMAAGSEIEIHLFNDGNRGIFKINHDEATHRARHLVEQAAGFSEIDVFCILCDLGNFHRINLTIIE